MKWKQKERNESKKRKNLKLIQNKRKKEIINWMQKILIESKKIKLKQKKKWKQKINWKQKTIPIIK